MGKRYAAAVDDEGPPRSLLALPSFAMGRISARGRRGVVERLRDEGLLLRHYAALAALEQFAPCAQRTLAARLGWDPADLVGILDGLEQRGLIRRRRDPADRRRQLVELSDVGAGAVARCHRLAAEAQEEMLAPLTGAQRQTLAGLLAQLVESPSDAPRINEAERT